MFFNVRNIVINWLNSITLPGTDKDEVDFSELGFKTNDSVHPTDGIPISLVNTDIYWLWFFVMSSSCAYNPETFLSFS